MAGTNNFLVFNEANNPNFTMSDADYASDLYRLNGLIPMIADPIAHNKMFRQWSIMITAIAGLIASMNYNVSDSDLATLQANLKSAIEDVAEAKVDPRITTLENWKSSITATPEELNILDGVTASTSELNILDGLTASTSELNTLHGITASTSELNILDGAEISTTELNYLDDATSNIQEQIDNLHISAFIPLRQDSTAYAIGDVVKIAGLSTFQYLECIATGTSASSLPPFNTTTGQTTVDGTCIWLCCDMRDGLQAGDMKYRFSLNDINGYIKMDTTKTLLYFDKDNLITNNVNFKYLRLFRLILNQALYTYAKDSLFNFEVSASQSTAYAYINPILLYGAGVVLINQWCNLSPLGFSTIEDITLQDYIDISTYNTINSVSYTEAQYKETAQTLLDDILNNTGRITIRISDVQNRYIKLHGDQKEWLSRLEDEGLPNITGLFGSSFNGTAWLPVNDNGGAFYSSQTVDNIIKPTNFNIDTGNRRFEFDASKSNPIYGRSYHVTPASLHLCLFIKY